MMEDEQSKNFTIAALKAGVVTVEFEKTNGELRKMSCTLHPEYLPKDFDPNAEPKKKPNPDVRSVWDINKQAWRSFRWDSVKSVTT